MPAAIPIAAAVGSTVLGSVLQNGQNKANQKNADNQAASARGYDAAALQKALASLQGYEQSNPSPVAGQSIAAPSSVYGTPQQAVNSPTQQVGAPPSASGNNPGMVAALLSGGQMNGSPVQHQGTRINLPPGLISG